MKTDILLIEDDPGTASALKRILQEEGYEVASARRGDEGLRLALDGSHGVVITDLKMPGLDGLELVSRLHAAKPKLPIIVMTAHGTTETAIEAMKFGAYEYLMKPIEADELLDLISTAIEASRLMTEPIPLGEAGNSPTAIIGNSRAMQAIYKEIGRVAAAPVNVLIRGETGTGKELIARAIYQHSERADKPFIAINCAAIPETLLESELFGHERGSFTGAQNRRVGRFEQAHEGTLFLDEIGDLPPSTQAKLLRVLQDRRFNRLGGNESILVNVRILAATHRDLESAIQAHEFREDLYYRLSGVTLTLPPLRERPEDIAPLVRFFIRRHAVELASQDAAIHPDAITLLEAQPWPGNVRELENVVREALLIARPFGISLEHVQQVVSKSKLPGSNALLTHGAYVKELLASAQRGDISNAYAKMLTDIEPELYRQAITLAQGNQAKAARWLGVSRLKMREKLAEFGLRSGTE